MKKSLHKIVLFLFTAVFTLCISNKSMAQKKDQMVRMSELEIDPAFLDQYKQILLEESEASVKLEAGVIAIFPMFQKENPTQLRILEIYADKEAYQAHLKTPHFLKYKTSTLKMVKSLNLVDMDVLDLATMPLLFKKLK
ncbi:antibiotic biosynthesis monooxygenase [Flavobacterium sp. MC2016-06]|jgi:quinol monooxygenase YgiN|uniref:putative quinol monooxygenase n=1 Tax=Flavobacterium sp. MC2016-06 TaxID=2676308 RepID=UPI0012BA7B44|nr:antibiotic biosynthesis monooxygenase [Flavobacterium sp. MC2016-06]